ncbi:MAG: sugar ABC transporter substrate-binding protein [Hyphomicrobiaceae bacterium]|nr:sugar ABC transporter substrate-binding protein [Hyphomicrobiaceae bacterium]
MRLKSILTSCAFVALAAGMAHAQDGTSLSVPSWMWEEGQVGEWFKANTATFEAANPGVTVQQTQIPAGDFEKTVTTQIAGGAAPDLMPAFTSMLAPMIEANALAPLDDCIAAGGFGDRLLPSVSYAQIDGHTYGVPLTMSPWSMVVNKALLEENGLAVPTTVDELYAVSQALKEKGIYGYAFGNDMSAPIHVYINSMQWVLGFGSDWSKDDGTITANDPRNIEAITWIKRFLDEGLSPVGLGVVQARELFVDGKVAVMFEGPWLMTQIQGSKPEMMAGVDFDVVPTPTHAAITGGAFYTIPAAAQHPDAACGLLTQYLSVDAQQHWLEDLKQIPGTVVHPSEAFLADNAWIGKMAEIAAEYPGGIGYAPPGYRVQAAEFRQIVVDALSQIYSGQTSVEDGLNALQAKLESWSATL